MMPKHTFNTARALGVLLFGSLVFTATSTTMSPARAAEACPCFSVNDIAKRCPTLGSNARQEFDHPSLELNCRPPSSPGITQRFMTSAVGSVNGVPVQWVCGVVTIPDDGGNWKRDESDVNADQEKACRQAIDEAVRTIAVKDDPERLKACQSTCSVEALRADCRAFWEDDEIPKNERDQGLADCDNCGGVTGLNSY